MYFRLITLSRSMIHTGETFGLNVNKVLKGYNKCRLFEMLVFFIYKKLMGKCFSRSCSNRKYIIHLTIHQQRIA